VTSPHPILETYLRAIEHGSHQRDPAQEHVVGLLVELARQLEKRAAVAEGPLKRWFGRRDAEAISGLYVWGGVGRGKTYLMDLFFDALRVERKQRIHFHRMMADVHGRLARLEDTKDPLLRVADDIAENTRVLCFDEFFVSDIGDAMILARLLEALFERGVVLVATSNVEPDGLYKDGLQRARFLPAIELLKRHTQVVELGGDTDYRLRLLKQAGTYLDADDPGTVGRLEHFFSECASSQIREGAALDVNGRPIVATRVAKSVAWFEFTELCDGPRSQADYIELARWYPTVIVAGVPTFDPTREDQARRFISLVDEFYDRRVKLIVSAAARPEELYAGNKLGFEFERTTSRLIEMQSEAYLREAHLA